MLLNTVQQQLQTIYQVSQHLSIEDFLINQETLEQLTSEPSHHLTPPKLKGFMLLLPEEDELSLAIYLNDQVMNNLHKHSPSQGLNENNIHDFCIMAEEVSHFLYITWKAQHRIQITNLELELQAEIDKFIICHFYCSQDDDHVTRLSLKELLFETFTLEETLSSECKNRYHTASKLARHYCHYLENHFIKKDHLRQMMGEIRRFYRLGQTDKISHINHTIFCQ